MLFVISQMLFGHLTLIDSVLVKIATCFSLLKILKDS